MCTLAMLLGMAALSSACAEKGMASHPIVGGARATSGTAASKPGDPVMTKIATFGAGCFWGVESAFSEVEGVVSTDVGYCGGTTKDPTYKDVCTDKTGHAEVVQVTYDPAKVTYQRLLEVFFAIHDPTQVNRQGPDHGTQYRSVVFTHDDEQVAAAKAYKEKLSKSGKYKQPIATTIEPAKPFYMAEDYHQQYFAKRGIKPTCHLPPPSGG